MKSSHRPEFKQANIPLLFHHVEMLVCMCMYMYHDSGDEEKQMAFFASSRALWCARIQARTRARWDK